MAQQTAVDFLYEFVQLKLTHKQQMQFEGLFQQAKQMEKEQIEESWIAGREFGCNHNDPETAEQYYNETYNTQNK